MRKQKKKQASPERKTVFFHLTDALISITSEIIVDPFLLLCIINLKGEFLYNLFKGSSS